jgi:hypothetical protein
MNPALLKEQSPRCKEKENVTIFGCADIGELGTVSLHL